MRKLAITKFQRRVKIVSHIDITKISRNYENGLFGYLAQTVIIFQVSYEEIRIKFYTRL